jgi:hypothetical protein
MPFKPKRLDWTAALVMVPLALGLFAALRLIAPQLSVAVAALVAAVASVLIVRASRVFLASRRHSTSGP